MKYLNITQTILKSIGENKDIHIRLWEVEYHLSQTINSIGHFFFLIHQILKTKMFNRDFKVETTNCA